MRMSVSRQSYNIYGGIQDSGNEAKWNGISVPATREILVWFSSAALTSSSSTPSTTYSFPEEGAGPNPSSSCSEGATTSQIFNYTAPKSGLLDKKGWDASSQNSLPPPLQKKGKQCFSSVFLNHGMERNISQRGYETMH